ncbi:hypothetical protein SynNOUM97013_01356 [Synechococcus sp. NOUM97013]|nr:hypothetical protein SynNOUM97013_01356 [Synechococcus sp. NOUM97013]
MQASSTAFTAARRCGSQSIHQVRTAFRGCLERCCEPFNADPLGRRIVWVILF